MRPILTIYIRQGSHKIQTGSSRLGLRFCGCNLPCRWIGQWWCAFSLELLKQWNVSIFPQTSPSPSSSWRCTTLPYLDWVIIQVSCLAPSAKCIGALEMHQHILSRRKVKFGSLWNKCRFISRAWGEERPSTCFCGRSSRVIWSRTTASGVTATLHALLL